MLCSKCSETIRPVVAIDIDGTLGDYHGHFLRFAEGFIGYRLPKDWDGTGEWSEALRLDKATYRAAKLAYRQGGMKRTMPAFRDASRCVRDIWDVGAEVWLTTTRPWLRLDNVDPDTREWLARNEVRYDRLLYDEDKYAVLAEQVDPERVVGVLDDLGDQYDRAAEMFGAEVPILCRNAFNWGVDRLHAMPLNQAGLELYKRTTEWKGA